jgi:acyl carrier protein
MTDQILKIIADYVDKPISKITPELTLADLGVDSLDFVEILFAIEEGLNIQFKGDASDLRKEIHSIADVIRMASEFSEQSQVKIRDHG